MAEEASTKKKNPKGRSSIYKGADGYWHGRVTMGVKDNGKPDRPHVMSKDYATVVEKVRELEKQRDSGARRRKPGRKKWTVEAWLNHWLTIVKPDLRERSYEAYEVAVRVHLIPGLGAHKLERLEPEHLERLYAKMQKAGAKPATAHQVHRTIRTALGVAEDRGHITWNPAAKAKAPRLDLDEDDEIEPYEVEEIQAILNHAHERRNGARWAIALALGLRQSEALGLKWTDVNLDKSELRVRRGRARPRYAHGCDKPCGQKHAGRCPQRHQTNSVTAPTKSKAGRRPVGLPPQLVDLLRAHKLEQDRERAAAGSRWNEEYWVFADRFGNAVNPFTDRHAWKALLKRAGIRDGRLHDARHTAATVLLLMGVPDRAVMGVMGWSSASMTKRYQHIIAKIRADIAQRLGALIWTPPEGPMSEAS